MPKFRLGKPAVIEVFLDPNAKKPVWVHKNLTEIYGPTNIMWRIAAKSPVQDFYFFQESLGFTFGACFNKPQIHDHRALVFDSWLSFKGDFPYVLKVEYQGNYFSTGSVGLLRRPCIRNL